MILGNTNIVCSIDILYRTITITISIMIVLVLHTAHYYYSLIYVLHIVYEKYYYDIEILYGH